MFLFHSFLRWTRPSILCDTSTADSGMCPESQEQPEELIAYMGLLEVEAAADIAAAAAAACDWCRGQCVPCTLFSCIDKSKTGFVKEGELGLYEEALKGTRALEASSMP